MNLSKHKPFSPRIIAYDPSRVRQWRKGVVQAALALNTSHLLEEGYTKRSHPRDVEIHTTPKTITHKRTGEAALTPIFEDLSTVEPETPLPAEPEVTIMEGEDEHKKRDEQDGGNSSSTTYTAPSYIPSSRSALAPNLSTTNLADRHLAALLSKRVYFYKGDVVETKEEHFLRMHLFTLMSVSVKAFHYMTNDVDAGDVREIWNRACTVGQPNKLTQLRNTNRALMNHQKPRTISFHEWYQRYTELIEDLEIVGMKTSEQFRISYLVELMAHDQRYTWTLRRITEKASEIEESQVVLLLAERAQEIGDVQHARSGTRAFRHPKHEAQLAMTKKKGLSQQKQKCNYKKGGEHIVECRNYARTGKCKYGIKCKFRHVGKREDQEKKTSDKEGNKPKYGGKANDTSKPACFQWEQNKTCSYGDRCRFKHGEESEHEKQDDAPHMAYMAQVVTPHKRRVTKTTPPRKQHKAPTKVTMRTRSKVHFNLKHKYINIFLCLTSSLGSDEQHSQIFIIIE